jgi:hypothetical protein
MVSERSLGIFGTRKPRRFISPYSTNPGEWLQQNWYDLNDRNASPVRITTGGIESNVIRVKSMREVIREYELHPENKSIPPQPDGWNSIDPMPHGVLSRRTVRIQDIYHIGKESNKLDDVSNHLVEDWGDVFTQYSHNDRSVIQQAFGSNSLRRIADMVNAESAALRERTDGYYNHYTGELENSETALAIRNKSYGIPVSIDHKVISRFFDGRGINPDHAAAIQRTAAKHIGQLRGIQSRIGYTDDLINPKLALAFWAETSHQVTQSGRRYQII